MRTPEEQERFLNSGRFAPPRPSAQIPGNKSLEAGVLILLMGFAIMAFVLSRAGGLLPLDSSLPTLFAALSLILLGLATSAVSIPIVFVRFALNRKAVN